MFNILQFEVKLNAEYIKLTDSLQITQVMCIIIQPYR